MSTHNFVIKQKNKKQIEEEVVYDLYSVFVNFAQLIR